MCFSFSPIRSSLVFSYILPKQEDMGNSRSKTGPLRATYPAVFSTMAVGQTLLAIIQEMIATSVPLISLGGRTTPAGGWLTSSSPGVGIWAVDMAAGLIAYDWGRVTIIAAGNRSARTNAKISAYSLASLFFSALAPFKICADRKDLYTQLGVPT